MWHPVLLASLALALIACEALSASLAAVVGTPTPFPSSTAQRTLSPTPHPSATAQATATLTPTATPAPTLPLLPPRATLTPAPTATVPAELDCDLMWQSPGNGITYEPGEEFTVGWKVINSGIAEWDTHRVIFTYLGGAKLYQSPTLELQADVDPGESVILSVEMRAPRNSTKYSTYWALRRGDVFFCRLALSIYVEPPGD
jgi:hypothetical protein